MVIHSQANVEAVRGKVAAGFSFAEIAFVVGDTLHIAGSEHSSKIAARIKHFQRLGIPSRRPGRGAKTPYGFDELIEIILSFQLVEAGMEPSSIIMHVRDGENTNIIDQVMQDYEAAIADKHGNSTKNEDARYLWFVPNFSTFRWFSKSEDRFVISLGNHSDLQKFISSLTMRSSGRLTIINTSSFAHTVFCSILRIVNLREG